MSVGKTYREQCLEFRKSYGEACSLITDDNMVKVMTQDEIKKCLESDPTGRTSKTPGAKLDQGKLRPSLIMDDMPRALKGVTEVATFGANKYTDGGWLQVPDGIRRYRDAELRHRSKLAMGETHDSDSGLPHMFHIAWNVMAQLELIQREQEKSSA